MLNVLGFEPRVVAEQLRHSDGGIARGRGLYGHPSREEAINRMRQAYTAKVTPLRGTKSAETAVVPGNLGGRG